MPVTILTGKNSYLMQQKLQAICDEFLKDHEVSGVVRLDAETASFEQLNQAVFEQGLFSAQALVILRDVSANKFLQEKLEPLLESVPADVELVIVDEHLDKRTTFFKTLKTLGALHDFAELDEFGLSRWALERFKELGGQMESNVAAALVRRAGTNQWMIAHELDKLLHHEQPVNIETVEAVVEAQFSETIFSLLDLAFSKQTDAAVSLYRQLVVNRVDPYYILSMVGWQLHAMVVVAFAGSRSEQEIARSAKLSPFVVRKSLGLLRHTTKPALVHSIDRFTEIDALSKTSGSSEPEVLVERLITDIAA